MDKTKLKLNVKFGFAHYIMHLTQVLVENGGHIKQNSRKYVNARVAVTMQVEKLETCQTQCLEFLVSNPWVVLILAAKRKFLRHFAP